MRRGGSTGSDDGDEGQGLATVTPIRPGIQRGDTTPFGTPTVQLPEPTPAEASPDEDGTWGGRPSRRMRVDDPDATSTSTAERTTAFGGPAADGCAIDADAQATTNTAQPAPAHDPYVRDELDRDEGQSASRRAPAGPISRRSGIVLVSLAVTLGGVVALTNAGGHTGKPRPASAASARRPATSALAATANKPATDRARSGSTARPHPHPRAGHRRHSGAHAHVPATSNRTATSQATVNSSISNTSLASSRASQTNAPATSVSAQPPSASTAPSGPTHSTTTTSRPSSTSSRPDFGQQGVLGPGHSPDS